MKEEMVERDRGKIWRKKWRKEMVKRDGGKRWRKEMEERDGGKR